MNTTSPIADTVPVATKTQLVRRTEDAFLELYLTRGRYAEHYSLDAIDESVRPTSNASAMLSAAISAAHVALDALKLEAATLCPSIGCREVVSDGAQCARCRGVDFDAAPIAEAA